MHSRCWKAFASHLWSNINPSNFPAAAAWTSLTSFTREQIFTFEGHWAPSNRLVEVLLRSKTGWTRIFTVPDSSRSKTTDLPASCKEQLIPLQPPQFSPVCYGIAIHNWFLNMILQTPVSCWGCLGVSLLKQERCCSLQVGGKESWIMWLKGKRHERVREGSEHRCSKNVHWCT